MQDATIFQQRLGRILPKLKGIAELTFVDAPHTLPLQSGQMVPMRAWWRHSSHAYVEDQDDEEDQGEDGGSASSARARKAAAPPPPPAQQQQQQGADWQASVLADWEASLKVGATDVTPQYCRGKVCV